MTFRDAKVLFRFKKAEESRCCWCLTYHTKWNRWKNFTCCYRQFVLSVEIMNMSIFSFILLWNSLLWVCEMFNAHCLRHNLIHTSSRCFTLWATRLFVIIWLQTSEKMFGLNTWGHSNCSDWRLCNYLIDSNLTERWCLCYLKFQQSKTWRCGNILENWWRMLCFCFTKTQSSNGNKWVLQGEFVNSVYIYTKTTNVIKCDKTWSTSPCFKLLDQLQIKRPEVEKKKNRRKS